MGEVIFVLPDGEPRSVEIEEGESLMRAAVSAGVPGIVGECGGEMSCATCHVWVDEEWSSLLTRPSRDEADLLEDDDNLSANSRLGCQIRFRPEWEHMRVRVPG